MDDNKLIIDNVSTEDDVLLENLNKNSMQVSLQDSFKKFRDRKIKERQIIKICKETMGSRNRSIEFKDLLRTKFIEGARKYLGVPYAERFKAPDAPVAPLYLDCCGLVRQVLLDLKEEFGFVIGRWNQCYQMDTLPIIYDDTSQMKPGDLIFYEGKYVSGRSKPQKHDNVHVEIFLGGETGEATIASRFHKGVVSEFASYKFKSTTWDLVKFHYRSIDTWLDGICISHCPEHPWDSQALSLAAAAGKKSIFACESDDENAGGIEEVEQDEEVNPEVIEQEKESTEVDTESIIQIKSNVIPNSVKSIGRNKSLPNISKSNMKGNKTSSQQFTYYVGKSNGWKLVKDALDKRGWQQLPFEYNFSNRYNLKWVERRSQIDYKAHTSGQLCNHFPNNDVITTKTGLVKVLRSYFCKDMDYSLNSIRNIPWIPLTFCLENDLDIRALMSLEHTKLEMDLNSIWIYKPSSNNRGHGISLVKGKTQLDEICANKKGIIQKYIENPLLIGEDKLKFDIRCYLLISRSYPTTLAFYHKGYCRLTLKPFHLDETSLNDPMVHLTNASIQKKNPIYDENKEKQIQMPISIADSLESFGNYSSANYIRDYLDNDIKKCLIDIMKAVDRLLPKKHGYFDLLGCDFMLSSDNKLILLEVNTNPALSLDNLTLASLLPNVVDSAIHLVLQTQGPNVDITKTSNSFENNTNFEFIYEGSEV